MKSLIRISGAFLLVIFLTVNSPASPAKDLEKAAEKKQAAFVLLIDKDSGEISKYKRTIKDAIRQAGHAVMVVVNRSDSKNADLVKRNGLSSMRVPMIVFYQPTGARGVIYPADKVTPEILARLVPSPKKAQMMEANKKGNAAIITVGDKRMKSIESIADSCEIACGKADGKAISLRVDINDKEEQKFLKELGIDTGAAEPQTIVTNTAGQVSAKFIGQVKVDSLVEAATRKAKGCCGSKAGGSTCGPKKQ